MTRKFSDWGGNIAAFLCTIAVNGLANALPLNGLTTGEVSARYPSPFTPAGFTFSIWALIYLALTLFVLYQALPSQRGNAALAGIGPLFKLNCLANAAWIFAWHYDQLLLSLLLIALILGTLVVIYRRLEDPALGGGLRRWTVQLPFRLYTGWLTVANIANLSTVQTGMGWDNAVIGETQWTLIKLAAAGAIGAWIACRRSDAVFTLVIAWAAYGISAKQVDNPAIVGAATVIALLMCALAGAALLRRSTAKGVLG
jgi:hypothetical protein